MKNRVVFIIPYYSSLPSYFHVWKYSALLNEDFDFLLITDIREICEEKNIHVVQMSFSQLKRKIQECFDFEICLDTPYKLCDFRPAFGMIFKDLIQSYDFWGHCDTDILLGNLKNFITDELLDSYDKIYEHGHMTLYRKTDSINGIFLSDGKYPEYNYKEVFQSPESKWFDEFYGMMLKCRRLKLKTYYSSGEIADLNPFTYIFQNVLDQNKKILLKWNNNCLYSLDPKDRVVREIAYAHFQKRDFSNLMNFFDSKKDVFIIDPNISRTDNKLLSHLPFILRVEYWLNVKIKHITDFVNRYNHVKKYYRGVLDYYQSRQKLKQRRKIVNSIIKSK